MTPAKPPTRLALPPRRPAAGGVVCALALLALAAKARPQAQAQAPPAVNPQNQSQQNPAGQAPSQASSSTPSNRLHIRVINARTNKPVPDEQLNVWLRPNQIGGVPTATDKNGDIFLNTGQASTLRVLSNFYADCRPRGELYTDYSIADIRSGGLTAGNLCSSAHPAPRANLLLLYVIPRTYIRTMGQPPADTLPHSDENPNQ